jgi:uncharacterized protein (DUF362 family)
MSGSIGESRLEAHRVGLALASPRRSAEGMYDDARALHALVRDAMVQAGLGQRDVAAPLADVIPAGGSVLLKPNWVLHKNNSGASMDCMVTHPAFILAALGEVLAAGAGRVIIADAPIQSARFNVLASPAWRERVAELGGRTPVEILDFRNTVATVRGRDIRPRTHLRDAQRFVRFDLESDSLLEPISWPVGRFRCTSYDLDNLARVQRPGVHQYLLCREPFEVDVILNLPKLKTHAKTGVTAALKNLVGVNGDKNFLPHHRVGGSALSGDCYEGLKPFKRAAEAILDRANRRIGKRGYLSLMRAARLANAIHGGDLEGTWAGNDTTWRMVLDLNRVVQYGRLDGTLADEPQRTVYSLTDGIVAGEHNGPLAPEPISLGAVTFGANSAYCDAAHLALMRLAPERMPLVREAFAVMPYPIAEGRPEETEVRCRDASYTLDEVATRFGRDFCPPDGWRGRV